MTIEVNVVSNNEREVEFISGSGTRTIKTGAVTKLFFQDEERVVATSNGVSIVGTLTASGDVEAFSDRSLKTNITPIFCDLAWSSYTFNLFDDYATTQADMLIEHLNGYFFQWEESGDFTYGVIADEVAVNFPYAVSIDQQTGKQKVSIPALVGISFAAINHLHKRIQRLEDQIIYLRTIND